MKILIPWIMLWLLIGVVVAIYVDLQSYRWRKRHKLLSAERTLRPIKATLWLICYVPAIVGWPVTLIFYKFWLQDEYDEANCF